MNVLETHEDEPKRKRREKVGARERDIRKVCMENEALNTNI